MQILTEMLLFTVGGVGACLHDKSVWIKALCLLVIVPWAGS